MSDKVNVVLFSGGRGTASISAAMVPHPQITLTLLVNAYDDGKSTGRLRRFIPGMLGPSDVRKNLARLVPGDEPSDAALRYLLEFRLPGGADWREVERTLSGIAARDPGGVGFGLAPFFGDLALGRANLVASLTRTYLDYASGEEATERGLDYGDCSLGNLWFAGAYLECGREFNRAVTRLHDLVPPGNRVMNVTDGRGLSLVGVKRDGSLLASESAIVSEQSPAAVDEIFLLDEAPDARELRELEGRTLEEIRTHLGRREIFPGINPRAAEALREADLIVYGPGTQHSSLLPSYLTEGVAEAIAANESAEKVFVGNILKDHEIQSETAATLTRKLLAYLNRKGRRDLAWNDLVTHFFLHAPEPSHPGRGEYLDFKSQDFAYPADRVVLWDWEQQRGAHVGGRVVDELTRLVNQRIRTKLKPPRYMVSIIVPGLDEARTVRQVLHELALLDFQGLGLGKEILYVDGGSTDGTWDLARAEPDVKATRLDPPGGRGEAIRAGIERASGDVIAFFPSDGEYDPRDLVPVVMAIVKNEFQAVFGSRNIKLENLTGRIKLMYGGNRIGYLISKYGGLLLGVLTLLLYNRSLSDVFSTVKAFDAGLLRSLDLRAKGVDLETEIIAKLGRRGTFILEVPVRFRPRRKEEGKKTTLTDGLRALFSLIRLRFTRHEEAVDHHPSL